MVSLTNIAVSMLNLHSNMFLLIQSWMPDFMQGLAKFTFQYVSINTIAAATPAIIPMIFTFQYVSINTLHISIALLLVVIIYIPICFY